MEFSQARILEWVAISFSRGSSGPRDWTQVSCIGGRIIYHLSPQGEGHVFKQSFKGNVSPWSHPQKSFLFQNLPELPTTLREEPKNFTKAPYLSQLNLPASLYLLAPLRSLTSLPSTPPLRYPIRVPSCQKCPFPFPSCGSFPSHPSRSCRRVLGNFLHLTQVLLT